jgi:transcriptional regulator with XRE-family HTH domain
MSAIETTARSRILLAAATESEESHTSAPANPWPRHPDDAAANPRVQGLQNLLRGRREALGLSQEEVAARLEISARSYGNWERGQVKGWTIQKLHGLASVLAMSDGQVARLFSLATDRAPQPDPRTAAAPADFRAGQPAVEYGGMASRRPSSKPPMEHCRTGPRKQVSATGKRPSASVPPEGRTAGGPSRQPSDGRQWRYAEGRGRRLQDFLRGRREALGLSQEEVAARLEISARAYGNWERGQVKGWTDEKLHGLASALSMSEGQTARLFWLAVDRPPQPDPHNSAVGQQSLDPAAEAFLDDYSDMLNSLPLPTFLVDHRWDVKVSNQAYRDLFSKVRRHPTAMPTTNFLQFGLFHPDAPAVLADYEQWQVALLAQLTCSLERHDQDPILHAMRRTVHLHPTLRDTYSRRMPDWLARSGTDLLHYEGAVRVLRHPDPHVGLQGCRFVEETPRSLQALGLSRITLLLVAHSRHDTSTRDRSHDHHAA